MITLDTTHITLGKIGETHGLDWEQALNQYQEKLAALVQNLYATKNESGSWKKWLNLGYDTQLAQAIETYAASVKGRFNDMVVLGIGGSSLGGKAMLDALLDPNWNLLSHEQRGDLPRYHFVETVDSDYIHSLFNLLNPKETLFIVITKSGTTPETMSAYAMARTWLEKHLSADAIQNHLVTVTDANTGELRKMADNEGYTTFEVPDDVGGRFSVFSAVGLLPAALCGISLAELQQGIRDLDKVCQQTDLSQNIAAQSALIHYLYYHQGKTEAVLMPYSKRLSTVAKWFVQLWDESLGKKFDLNGNVVHVGPTAIEAQGPTDQHSQLQNYIEGPFNKLVTFIEVQKPDHDCEIPAAPLASSEKLAYLQGKSFWQLLQAELAGTRESLAEAKRPSITLKLPKIDAYHFAQILYLFEVQTALMGGLLNINPFDQEGVEAGKKITKARLNQPTATV